MAEEVPGRSPEQLMGAWVAANRFHFFVPLDQVCSEILFGKRFFPSPDG
jgi:hypothetical protein